jgi:hypothetical protein
MRPLALLLTLAALAALPAAAGAQDSHAPPGAEKHWLPDERWVNLLWLPYDEHRLYEALGRSRGEVFRWIRVDAHNSLAQLARRRGLGVRALAARLVANRAGKVPPATLRSLRRRAERTLTQPHLAQHLLFHALHQTAIAGRARHIFGVRSEIDFLRLRRAELSPLQIGELFARTRTEMAARAARALRDAADRGVRSGELSPRQRAVLLDRQLRQLPRWLGQKRYNGPTGGRNRPRLPPADVAKRPALSGDGSLVVWDAYRTDIAAAERRGEIHVRGLRLAGGPRFSVSPTAVRAKRPVSAYNVTLAADAGVAAYETAESTYPLAKRVGQMSIWVRDLATGRAEKVSHLGLPAGAPTRTAFNPSLSADGRLVAFEATDSGSPSRNGLWLADREAGAQRLLLDRGSAVEGGALLPRLSADGASVAYTRAAERGVTQVCLLDVASGREEVVSLGAAGPASSDAYEPSPSRDGAVVAFTSRAGNLGAGPSRRSRVWVRDRAAGTTELVSGAVGGDALEPSVSADGRWVAFVARRAFRGGSADRLRSSIWLHDRRTGRTTRIARPRGFASEPVVSADGRTIAWVSTAPVRGKPAGLAGILVHDMATHRTRLVSEHRLRRGGGRATGDVPDVHAHE